MMFNRVSHPGEVIDVVLVDVSNGEFINMLVGVWSIGASGDVIINTLTDLVIDTSVIALEFIVRSSYVEDVLGNLRTGVTIEVVTDIGVDVLVDVMTALDFVLPALLKESKPIC